MEYNDLNENGMHNVIEYGLQMDSEVKPGVRQISESIDQLGLLFRVRKTNSLTSQAYLIWVIPLSRSSYCCERVLILSKVFDNF